MTTSSPSVPPTRCALVTAPASPPTDSELVAVAARLVIDVVVVDSLGMHTIVARTTDIYGTAGEATVTITRGEPLDVDGVDADAAMDVEPTPAGGCCQSSRGDWLGSVFALLLVTFVLSARRTASRP